MRTVGLTGNFGMGKSKVLEAFRELGAFTVDADEIVSELLERKDVLEKLRQVLGDEVFTPDGALDRNAVADRIFRDESLRMTIEDILHPLVFERIDEMLKDVSEEIVVVEATLIFERGHEGRFEKVITVHTDEETALQRLEDEGIPREDALKRILNQLPIEEKIRRSDFSIDNAGPPEATRERVKEIYASLTGKG